MGKKITETFKLSEEMLEKLNAIRDAGHNTVKEFTAEQDAMILEFYDKKNKAGLAKIVGVCASTMRNRHKELTEERNE